MNPYELAQSIYIGDILKTEWRYTRCLCSIEKACAFLKHADDKNFSDHEKMIIKKSIGILEKNSLKIGLVYWFF